MKENLEKVFKILDKEKNGVISTDSLSFPEGIEECDADLLSDILSSHSSPEIGFDMFWDLLVNLDQCESVLEIFKRIPHF